MKYEWRKSEKGLYGAKQKPELVEVPSQQFIVIEGAGDPNAADFSERVSALYSLAYSIKMLFKSMMKDKVTDFTVYPLKGIWAKAAGEGFDKSQLRYQLMIQQPTVITQDIFAVALENVRKKKPHPLYDDIRWQSLPEERAIQFLHIGGYDSEAASFEKMDELASSLGLERCDQVHREIYLSNKNRTPEEKLKTILRYAVR